MDQIRTELGDSSRSCLLPAQSAAIGSELFDAKYFDEFRTELNGNLHRVFDIWNDRSNQSLLRETVQDTIKLDLVLLYCEQTSKHIQFRTDQVILSQSIEDLRNYVEDFLNDQTIRKQVFDWYKQRVTTTLWKNNHGASHGLATYCEILHKRKDDSQITIDDGLFLLSAGTLMMEHFEHVYKELGLIIYLAVINTMNKTDLESTNVHEPIFDICQKNISNIKDIHINHLLWTCLIKCLDLKPSCRSEIPSKWNHRDDICSALLTRLAFESDVRVRSMLMRCVPEVFGIEVDVQLRNASNDDVFDVDMQHFRDTTKDRICLVACRWTKKLLKIWSYHVSCLFGLPIDVAVNLKIVHMCYLICLFGIPLKLIANELKDFLNEFPTHLLQLVQYNGHDKQIIKELDQVLQTLIEHISTWKDVLCEDDATFFKERSKTLSRIKLELNKQ